MARRDSGGSCATSDTTTSPSSTGASAPGSARSESGPERIEPAGFVPRAPRTGDTIEADELLARLDDPRLVIVDARAPERFRGDESDDPIARLDPVLGHIPGAVNAPHAAGAIPEELAGAGELAVYCGSGVTACVDLLRLARMGRPDARLYPGSWSEWSRRGLPAERV